MADHTPGPWWTDDSGCVAAGSSDDYVTVADLNCNALPDDEKAKNRALIAASPDLLEACEAVIEADHLYDQAMTIPREPENEARRRKAIAHAIGMRVVALEKVRAAIIKAAGE